MSKVDDRLAEIRRSRSHKKGPWYVGPPVFRPPASDYPFHQRRRRHGEGRRSVNRVVRQFHAAGMTWPFHR